MSNFVWSVYCHRTELPVGIEPTHANSLADTHYAQLKQIILIF